MQFNEFFSTPTGSVATKIFIADSALSPIDE